MLKLPGRLRYFSVQAKSQRFGNFQDGRKAWIAGITQRLVQAFASQPTCSSYLCHALRSRDIAEGPGNAGRLPRAKV
jgi:hypothetical protein